MNQEQIAKLKELAQAAENEVIRSHGWAGSVEMLETLRIDEEYLTAASPAAILELIAKVQTPLEDHNARFAIDGAMWKGSENVDPPPTEDHWLMPYWKMARELAEFKAAAERTTAPVSLTDEKIIEAIDRPGFAWENLDAAEQRNLLGSIRALLAAAPAPIQQPQDAEDTARLDFITSDKCIMDCNGSPDDKRYWLSWPYLYEEQGETYATPREAIDAARAALAKKGGAA